MSLARGINVARARMRGGSSADRAPLEAALGQVGLDGLGLGPRAVLYVPRLAPRRVLRRRDPAGFAGVVGEALAGEARAAMRCRPGEATGSGPLLFDSEADFLAWLIGGWLRGERAPSLALAGIAAGRGAAAWLALKVLARGELVPALFERLARSGSLAGLLRAMPPADLRRSLAALARAHGLPAILIASDAAPEPHSVTKARRERPGSRVQAGTAGAAARRGGSHVQALLAEAVEGALPGEARALPGEARALAALALGLARAPDWMRSPEGEAFITQALAGEVHTSEALLETRVDDAADRRIDRQVVETTDTISDPTPLAESPAEAAAVIAGTRPEIIRSDFGGVLFLLPLLLDLGLYADFARPLGANLPLSPWLVLRRIGRRRFARRFAADPLDALLARLAGVPADAPLGRAPRGVKTSEIDVRLGTELVRRTGLAPRAARALLRRPASIRPGDGALDVEFALEGHPLALRMAGLDRDPGWIPAAGRAVAFHFR